MVPADRRFLSLLNVLPSAWGLLLCCGLGLPLLAGCGGGAELPELYNVSGTVTYKGEPVTDATVWFSPAEGGRPSSGKLDEKGNFKMAYSPQVDGVQPGKNIISLMPPNPGPEDPPLSDRRKQMFETYRLGKSSHTVTVEEDTKNMKIELK